MESYRILSEDVDKYLHLRRVFRISEALVSLIVLSVSLIVDVDSLSIIICILALLAIPELYLAFRRSIIKHGIRYVNSLLKEHINFCSTIRHIPDGYSMMVDETNSIIENLKSFKRQVSY